MKLENQLDPTFVEENILECTIVPRVLEFWILKTKRALFVRYLKSEKILMIGGKHEDKKIFEEYLDRVSDWGMNIEYKN